MTITLFLVAAVLFPALIGLLVLRRVEDMEAVVVRERLTGRVTGLFVGPRFYVRIPALDSVERLDLHFRRTTVQAHSMQTYEGLSANVTITAGWQMTPERLHGTSLREVLPYLPQTADIVENWMLFTVRNALSKYSLETLMRVMRRPQQFQQALLGQMQSRLDPLGVVMLDLDLICLPSAAVAATRLQAEARAQELQTIAAARADEVRMLSQALDCGHANDALVKLLAIDALRSGNQRIITSLDLGNAAQNAGGMPIQFVVGPSDQW